jgi:Short C-terminal domain
MMMRRRRPLARAAIVGGAAYYGGKKVAEGRQYQAEQEARIDSLEQQQYQQQQYNAPAPPAPAPPPAPAAAAGGVSQETINQLQQLGQLKEQGILTDEEFTAQKKKLLGMS